MSQFLIHSIFFARFDMRLLANFLYDQTAKNNNNENMSTTSRASSETTVFDLIWKAGQTNKGPKS